MECMYHTATTIEMGVEGEGVHVFKFYTISEKGFNFEIDIEAHFFTLLVSYLLLTMEELYTFERVEANFKILDSENRQNKGLKRLKERFS